jgi:hypothetical protein
MRAFEKYAKQTFVDVGEICILFCIKVLTAVNGPIKMKVLLVVNVFYLEDGKVASKTFGSHLPKYRASYLRRP